MKPVIAFFDVHADDQAAYIEALGSEFDLKLSEAPLSGDTAPLAKEAHVLSVHVTSRVTAALMRGMPKLTHVACRTTGYDNVDLAYAKAHKITVSTVPAYGEATVAEYSFLLMLAAARRLMLSAHSVLAGQVTPTKLTGHDLSGKTIGIIGTGRIGRHAAGIARGFGMNILAYDPYPNDQAAAELGFTYSPLDDLLARADYLTLHAPATPKTHHLLDKAAFAKTKRGVILVNTARGDLIETSALIDAVQVGRVAAAALDVIEGEEYLEVSAELNLLHGHRITNEAKEVLGIDILHKMPNVLITSHNAYNTVEALQRIRDTTIGNIRAALTGKPQNLVPYE